MVSICPRCGETLNSRDVREHSQCGKDGKPFPGHVWLGSHGADIQGCYPEGRDLEREKNFEKTASTSACWLIFTTRPLP